MNVDLIKFTTYMLRNHGYIAHVLMMLYSLVVAAEYASARCECVLSSLPFFLSFFQKQELMHLSEEEKQQSGRQISPT